jgi:glutamine synthetase
LGTDVYELPPAELARLRTVPGSLDEVLRELEADHKFLLRRGVFTSDLLGTWLE